MGNPNNYEYENSEEEKITLSGSDIEKKEEPITDLLTEIRQASYNPDDIDVNEEEDNEDVEDGRLLTGQKYETPKDVDKFIDTAKGELIDKSKLSDWDVIKAVAKQTGTEIRNPRGGCKKCYGRGYIGWDSVTKAPIPCHCIYPPKTPDRKMQEQNQDKKNQPVSLNRKTIKKLRKLIKSEKKLIKQQKMEEELRLQKIENKEESQGV
jgi:hypothetical protein